MSAEGERLERAGRYVLGLMDESERERAERDLEFDAKFRAAVVGVAERMHLFDPGKSTASPAQDWQHIAGRIAEMPHLKGAAHGFVADAAAQTPRQAPRQPAPANMTAAPMRADNPGIAWRRLSIALFVAAVFALGYAVGFWSATTG